MLRPMVCGKSRWRCPVGRGNLCAQETGWVGNGDQINLEMVVEALAIGEHAGDSVGRSENKPIKGWSQGESTQNHVSVDEERVCLAWEFNSVGRCCGCFDVLPLPISAINYYSTNCWNTSQRWVPAFGPTWGLPTWRTLPESHFLPGVAPIHWPTQWDKGLASLYHLGQLCRATVAPSFPVELAETQVGVHYSSASPSAPSSFLLLPSVGTEPKCDPK